MAATVKFNTTVGGAFQVFVTALRVSKQRPTTPVITDAGNVGTKKGTAFTITGTMTFSIDSLRGAGLDLEAWEASEKGELVEYDRGPDHLILRNCQISGVDDSGNPGQGQRDVTVNFTAETDDKITG